jgi:hypothetical protein
MGSVIHLDKKRETAEESLITAKPWEFRWSPWGGRYFILMTKSLARRLEEDRKGAPGHDTETTAGQSSGHVPLKGGMADTIRGIFRYRHHEIKMREVYYLACLVDCMINQVSPLLRTSYIRRIYEKTMTMKKILDVNWYGHLDQVLFPIHDHLYDDEPYRHSMSRAQSPEELSHLIRERSDHLFEILSCEYTFYAPGRRGE